MRTHILLPVFVLVLSVSACNRAYQASTVNYKDYRVGATQPSDSMMQAILQPYRDSVNKSMNDIVGVADQALDKKLPGGTLGNFMADAFYTMAAEKFQTPVDMAVMNYGGIRLLQLPAGDITRGKIFELMPFDNLLILQKMKGSVLKQFLDLIALKGGWPVTGATMEIKNKQAVNIMIGGKPLDPGATYTIANSDFVANGGDNAEMLRNVAQESIGYLMRDALFDYIIKLKHQGKHVSANEENRMTNVQ